MNKFIKLIYILIGAFLLFLFPSKVLSASSDSLFIKFDAITQNYDASQQTPFTIPKDGNIVFEISNINLFLYNVSVYEEQNNIINNTNLNTITNNFTLDPVQYNLNDVTLSIKGLNYAALSVTKEIEEKEKVIHNFTNQIKQTEDTLNIISNVLSEIKVKIDKIKIIDKRLVEIENKLSSVNIDRQSDDKTGEEKKQLKQEEIQLKNQKKKLIGSITKDELYQQNDSLRNLRKQKVSLFNNLSREIENKKYEKEIAARNSKNDADKIFAYSKDLDKYQSSISKLNELSEFYQRLLCLLYSTGKSYLEIATEKENLTYKLFQKEIFNQDDLLDICFSRLRSIDKNFSELLKSYTVVKSLNQAEIDKNFTEINAFHSQIKRDSFYRFFSHISKVYNAINESNFSIRFNTLIIADNADLIKFRINAVPLTNLPCALTPHPISFTYYVYIKHGLKIDISTGAFANFFLNDKKYHFESSTINGGENEPTMPAVNVIEASEKSMFFPSIGVLLHMYRRGGRGHRFAFSFGASTDGNKLKYYLGPSLIMGRSQRFNLTFGLAGGQVKYVIDEFDPVNNPFEFPIDDLPSEVPLRNPSPFRIGGFFSFTFNLSGRINQDTFSKISTK